MHVSPCSLCFWLPWGIPRKGSGGNAVAKKEEKGSPALSSNHQLNQKSGSLEMSCVIYGASTFRKLIIGIFSDIKPSDFLLMLLNEIILSLVLPGGHLSMILCYVLFFFTLGLFLPYLFNRYTSLKCSLYFFCTFCPALYMNTLKIHSFSFTSFCFVGLIKLLLKIPLDQKKRCWALDTGIIKCNCCW